MVSKLNDERRATPVRDEPAAVLAGPRFGRELRAFSTAPQLVHTHEGRTTNTCLSISTSICHSVSIYIYIYMLIQAHTDASICIVLACLRIDM